MIRIELTPKQAEYAGWATDPMINYWSKDPATGGSEGDPEKFFAKDNIIRVEGTTLWINPDPDILEDFEYRITEQLPQMIEDRIGDYIEGTKGRVSQAWANSQYKVCENLWQRVKEATDDNF